MTLAELHRSIRAIVPSRYSISVHAETYENERTLSVEFKAFVHGVLMEMYEGSSPDAVYEQVYAKYTGTASSQMHALETDLSELEAT